VEGRFTHKVSYLPLTALSTMKYNIDGMTLYTKKVSTKRVDWENVLAISALGFSAVMASVVNWFPLAW
jgi:hypothetical protein